MLQETTTTENRRREPRLRRVHLVQISHFDEEGFRDDLATGRTLDISQGGVRLELYHPLPLRSIVELNLALDDEVIEARGTVVYLEVLDEERCAMGIAFDALPEGAVEIIENYVRNHLS